jgi:hypothetical protein
MHAHREVGLYDDIPTLWAAIYLFITALRAFHFSDLLFFVCMQPGPGYLGELDAYGGIALNDTSLSLLMTSLSFSKQERYAFYKLEGFRVFFGAHSTTSQDITSHHHHANIIPIYISKHPHRLLRTPSAPLILRSEIQCLPTTLWLK